MDLFLLGFLHYQGEVAYFGKRDLLLVRERKNQCPDLTGQFTIAFVQPLTPR